MWHSRMIMQNVQATSRGRGGGVMGNNNSDAKTIVMAGSWLPITLAGDSIVAFPEIYLRFEHNTGRMYLVALPSTLETAISRSARGKIINQLIVMLSDLFPEAASHNCESFPLLLVIFSRD